MRGEDPELPVLGRDAVRELDRRAIEERGVPSLLLMENAGRACADEALDMLDDEEAPVGDAPVVILCGPGNNGGDGLVIARSLLEGAVLARVVLVGGAERLERASADVRANARRWRDLGCALESVESEEDVERLAPDLERAPLVVDALFGTGLTRPLEGVFAGVIEAANRSGAPILAVDLPSGLDADTGEVLGTAVRAARTVSFVAAKPGFTRGAGPELCGRVRVAEIGIPRDLVEDALAQRP